MAEKEKEKKVLKYRLLTNDMKHTLYLYVK